MRIGAKKVAPFFPGSLGKGSRGISRQRPERGAVLVSNMVFEAHGDFEIVVKGEVFIIRFFHKWNLEGAQAFFTEYKKCVGQYGFKKYGVLSDLRFFEGGTLEAIDYFEIISDWAEANGQIARALIMDSVLKELTMEAVNKGKERFPARAFSNESEALDWFKGLGLSIL